MRRILSLLLILSLALCLFSGCQEEEEAYVPTGDALDSGSVSDSPGVKNPETVAEITLAYYPEESMNPLQSTDLTNRTLFSLIYQGLFTVDRDYNCSPVLCRSYNVSADMKTYTFYLENAYFSDGTPLSANDVVASLKAAQESGWYGSRLRHVSEVNHYGDAVVIELDTAMENLPILLDIPIVKASEVEAAQPLGTGPYRMDGSQLKRQAGWWCAAELPVSCDTIALVEAQSAADIRDEFEFGNVSLVTTDPGGRDYVSFHSDYELWDCETGLFLYLVVNSESQVFANSTIRSALTYVIDRDSIVETVYRGFADSATLPASPKSPVYSAGLAAKYGYAPERFEAALQETEFESAEITLLLNADSPARVQAGQMIADMLGEYGFTVTITKASGSNFTSLLKKGNYDLYLAQTKLSPNMDLSAFFLEKTVLSYGGLANPSLLAVSLEALANSGNYFTLHEMVMQDAHLLPILFQSNAVYVRRGSISELNPARDTVIYYDLGRTLADALKSE